MFYRFIAEAKGFFGTDRFFQYTRKHIALICFSKNFTAKDSFESINDSISPVSRRDCTLTYVLRHIEFYLADALTAKTIYSIQFSKYILQLYYSILGYNIQEKEQKTAPKCATLKSTYECNVPYIPISKEKGFTARMVMVGSNESAIGSK